MTDAPMPDAPPPDAKVRTPSRYSLIWLVPLIAAAIAAYLGWSTLASRGPLITITFDNGSGLAAGETRVEHKAVAIGTVEGVKLADGYRKVVASVRIAKGAAPMLTTHARFWIVRPRFTLTDISALQTLVSGSYIAVDPGPPGGQPERHFTGLSEPPGVRSDEPGSTFTLEAPRLGWLQDGAPVFYRDIPVGQLISYREPGMGKDVRMHIFIRAPFDGYVRAETHFWNTSGLSMSFGPAGVHVAVESLQALLAGGISFANFGNADQSPPPKPGSVFTLYDSFDEAENAGFHDNIQYVTYFNQSVAGLSRGSAVSLFGIRVGTVTGTQLLLDPKTGAPRVRVTFDVQPERVYAPSQVPKGDPVAITRELVKLGMRARIDTANLLTGQEEIGLDIVPGAGAAQVSVQDGRIVWPSAPGGFSSLEDSVQQILAKLNGVPLERLGTDADALLASLRRLAATANDALEPLGKKLPEMASELQSTLAHANRLLSSMQAGYGDNSRTQQDLQRLTTQATSALQSVQSLAEYLQRHPGSLVWGR